MIIFEPLPGVAVGDGTVEEEEDEEEEEEADEDEAGPFVWMLTNTSSRSSRSFDTDPLNKRRSPELKDKENTKWTKRLNRLFGNESTCTNVGSLLECST